MNLDLVEANGAEREKTGDNVNELASNGFRELGVARISGEVGWASRKQSVGFGAGLTQLEGRCSVGVHQVVHTWLPSMTYSSNPSAGLGPVLSGHTSSFGCSCWMAPDWAAIGSYIAPCINESGSRRLTMKNTVRTLDEQ